MDHGSPEVRQSLKAPEEIKFEVNEEVKGYLKRAEENYEKLVGDHDLHVRAPSLCLLPTSYF